MDPSALIQSRACRNPRRHDVCWNGNKPILAFFSIMRSLASLAAALGVYTASQVSDIFRGQQSAEPRETAARQPNILFILTDDQDLELDSVEYMPLTQKHLIKKGTDFRNHFVTTAICCPSRVSLWTGRQAHNTNVTDVAPPWGVYCRHKLAW